MQLAIDLGARHPHEDDRWPGNTFIIRALPATVSLYCRDQAKRFSTDGSLQFHDNNYLSWLFRFGVERIEGFKLVVSADEADEKPPPFLQPYAISDSAYPLMTSFWFDRVHPLAVRAIGTEVQEWNQLAVDVKKNSASPAGGEKPAEVKKPGTAEDAPKPRSEATDTTSPAEARST